MLLPKEEVQAAFTMRGEKAWRLVASFWDWRPDAPLLLEVKGVYKPFYCMLDGEKWSGGPLCARHVHKLLASTAAIRCEKLQLFVPGEQSPEATRPAILRQKSIVLD